jgi:DNA invertase Pin-like site-specific DNA recombinase
MFRGVASGAKSDRTQLRRVPDELAAGDVVMVTRLDRLSLHFCHGAPILMNKSASRIQ